MSHTYRDENGNEISAGLHKIITDQGDLSMSEIHIVLVELHKRLAHVELWMEDSDREAFERRNRE